MALYENEQRQVFPPHTYHCFLEAGQAEEPWDTWLLLSSICAYSIEEFSFY